MWLLWVLATLVLIAAMSAGLALGMHLLFPKKSERARIIWAAGLSAFLPMSLAFGGFLMEVSVGDDEFLISTIALVLISFMILSVCCLPPAWWATTKLEQGKDGNPQLENDDPELIEG